MERTYLQQSNDRRLPPDYAGDILVWDIDKTYLDTHFSSLRGLLAIPFELAVDKNSIPGAATLLRALRHGPSEKSALVPLYFISGSPLELRKTVERKMTIDGVEYDGITFKDQLGLLKKGRIDLIRAQLGYKLKALLLYRRELPDNAHWYLFGDDVEQDAESFLMFGAICAGYASGKLREDLRSRGVTPADVQEILNLSEEIPHGTDPVENVFIHLERNTDPTKFTDRRLIATRSYIQGALVLAAKGRIRKEAVAAVAKDLRRRMMPEATLAEHIADAEGRLGVPRDVADLARIR